MNFRKFEKSKKYGYLFFISYNGQKFDCFDENKGKISIKSVFKDIMTELGISWAKGIQQAGRTDSNVSAENNLLYFSSNFNGDMDKIINEFNSKSEFLKINKFIKTLADLNIPDLVEKREYIYSYPLEKINKSEEEIKKTCLELSGKYDVSKFTDTKGLNLKEKIREVYVLYENNSLIFLGNSFMPKQVRIMSSYILSGEKKIFPAKYLKLNKVILKQEFEDLIIKNTIIPEELQNLIIKAEKIKDFNIFYVEKSKKGELIGKNASNIKKLRKKYGNIIIK